MTCSGTSNRLIRPLGDLGSRNSSSEQSTLMARFCPHSYFSCFLFGSSGSYRMICRQSQWRKLANGRHWSVLLWLWLLLLWRSIGQRSRDCWTHIEKEQISEHRIVRSCRALLRWMKISLRVLGESWGWHVSRHIPHNDMLLLPWTWPKCIWVLTAYIYSSPDDA